ncbi:hypothetical protein ONA92_26790 [Mycobacteroides salmoniphilum]|uniref:hypothetical protein n=1 Tax=Mycobacteroides salmoniphilum TaxID=404941 RepID=UPI00356826BC
MNAQQSVAEAVSAGALRTDLAQTLTQARNALAAAARVVTAWFSPEARDDDYGLAWDVNPIVAQTITTLTNLATAHNLPIAEDREPIGYSGDGPMALHPHLRAAYGELVHATAVAETLTTADHTYGAIGWDLETAIDDVLILVRDAARAGGLAGQRFWIGVL